jgi:hypothetical protein
MSRFNPRTSIFAGMAQDQLRRALSSAQMAYIELTTGGKVQAAAYTQGDGSKSVTYTVAEIGNLTMLIKELQAQLGIIRYARRPIRFVYR